MTLTEIKNFFGCGWNGKVYGNAQKSVYVKNVKYDITSAQASELEAFIKALNTEKYEKVLNSIPIEFSSIPLNVITVIAEAATEKNTEILFQYFEKFNWKGIAFTQLASYLSRKGNKEVADFVMNFYRENKKK